MTPPTVGSIGASFALFQTMKITTSNFQIIRSRRSGVY